MIKHKARFTALRYDQEETCRKLLHFSSPNRPNLSVSTFVLSSKLFTYSKLFLKARESNSKCSCVFRVCWGESFVSLSWCALLRMRYTPFFTTMLCTFPTHNGVKSLLVQLSACMMCLQSYTQPMNLYRNMTVSNVMQCSQSMWPQYSFLPAKYPHKSTLKVKRVFFLSGSCGDIVLFHVMLFCHHTGPLCVRHFPQQSILSLLLTSPVMIMPLYSLSLSLLLLIWRSSVD